jgi:hypothetical protein
MPENEIENWPPRAACPPVTVSLVQKVPEKKTLLAAQLNAGLQLSHLDAFKFNCFSHAMNMQCVAPSLTESLATGRGNFFIAQSRSL